MPIVFEHHTNSSDAFALWRITESEEFFHSYLKLNPEDSARVSACKQPHKRLEKWACRAIVAALTQDTRVNVGYETSGKPFLDGKYLSFSHSHGMAAAAISSRPIGIDIEKDTEKFPRLYHKFLNAEEISAIGNLLDVEKLCFYWCAKEAMYKLHAPVPYDLREGLRVVSDSCGKIIANDANQEVQLERFTFENYQIALAKWCL